VRTSLLLAATPVACAVYLAAAPVSAQQPTPCKLVSNAVVASAIGAPVEGSAQPGLPPGVDGCDFADATGDQFSVSRTSNTLAPGAALSPGALAQSYFPDLTDDAVARIDALTQPGISLALPGLRVQTVGGVGDDAVLVKEALDEDTLADTLVVRRGTDIFAFNTDDSPDAPDRLTALAAGVLTSVSP
jgi:hypothetical protein